MHSNPAPRDLLAVSQGGMESGERCFIILYLNHAGRELQPWPGISGMAIAVARREGSR